MTLLGLIILLCVLGCFVWIFNAYAPVAQPFKGIVIVIVSLVALLFVLNAFGVFTGLTTIRVR